MKSWFSEGRGLALICGLTLGGILVAGLWPFCRPHNQVTWSPDSNGLNFGHYGVVISVNSLKTARTYAQEPCSIELWLEPRPFHNNNTILSFHTPENPRQFSLSMWEKGLLLRTETHAQRHDRRVHDAFVADAFTSGKSRFVTITTDGQKSKVYLDGRLVASTRDFEFSAKTLTGQLVIGASPVSSDGWYGRLLGLAVYRTNRTSAQVLHDYELWTKNERPEPAGDDSALALYRFDERQGNTVHNSVSRGPDLYIPLRFILLDQPMLQSPWAEFRWTWAYWLDLAINIAGFVPLGFFFHAYLSKQHRPWAVTTSVLVGAVTSLTIELLQAYLPTRNSGVTDLLTNTFGTYIGAVFHRVAASWLS